MRTPVPCAQQMFASDHGRYYTLRMRSIWLPVLVGVSRLFAVVAMAGEPSAARPPLEELFQSDLVYTQEKGEIQVTLVSLYRNGRQADSCGVLAGVEYGLSDAWQIEVEWTPWLDRRPDDGGRRTSGVGDVEVATLYSFMNVRETDYHVAASFGVELPTASVDKELGEGFIDYEPSLIVARDFPRWHGVQLFSQLGLSLVQRVRSPDERSEREPAAHGVFWNAGFFVPFERFVVSSELNWSNNRWNHHGEENEWYVTPGVTWRLAEDWQMGVAIGAGLNETSDRYRIITQLVGEF